MIADFGRDGAPGARVFSLADALSLSMSAKVRPAPNAPILRKLRRLRPSQKPCLFPRNVNILLTPLSWCEKKHLAGCAGAPTHCNGCYRERRGLAIAKIEKLSKW